MMAVRRFDRAESHEVVLQLQRATVRHRQPNVGQTFMRWWNVSKVLEHLLRTADQQDRRIAELEKGRLHV